MDKCFFRVDDNYGNFSRCKALSVGYCPEKCKFRKTEIEYYAGVERAEKRLRDLHLVAVDDIRSDGVHIMTVKKRGE